MGDHPSGRLVTRLLDADVLEVTASGYVDLRTMVQAQQAIDALVAGARAGAPLRMLFDALTVEGFEPGLPWQHIRWFKRHAARFERMGAAVRSVRLVSLTRVLPYVLPSFEFAVFGTYRDAHAYVCERPRAVPAAGRASG